MSAASSAEAASAARSTAAATQVARARDDEGRLVAALTKLPTDLHRRLQGLAHERRSSVSFLLRGFVEAALDGAADNTRPTATRQRARSCRITLQLAPEDVRRAEVHAARIGTGTNRALADLVRLGLEAAEQGEGIPQSRAEDLLAVLHAVESLVARLGPTALGTQVLLAYWVAKASGGKVEEDELLQQSRLVGEDEWARVLDELRPGTKEED